ncbi:hypothetical protein NLI96_g738 [Meripilus lineatus]|uniref:DUF6533 domain-containing protein n=1 Tax=Meripilus lineatus TaxID=2056292 RepID=A0AAD5YNM4_9APHY|nr:hypothetical protein NLI96_g738 [Physisporinus lineatus]
MSSQFVHAAIIKENVTYLDIVAAAVLGYDYILTLPREIQYVWFTPLSLGKVLFFLTRYPVFEETSMVLLHQFAVMSPQTCDNVYKAIGYQLGAGTLVAESILAMRTWVIWHRNPYIGAIVLTGLVVFWVPVFYFLAQALNSLVFTTAPNPNTPGCFLLTQKNILFVVYVLITSFETIILGLTLIRFMPHCILNYVYLCVLSICNVTVLLTAPHGYATLLSALQRVLHSVLSGRVLLHLREAAANPVAVNSIPTASGFTHPTQVRFTDRFTDTTSWFGTPSEVASWRPGRTIQDIESFYDDIPLEKTSDGEH